MPTKNSKKRDKNGKPLTVLIVGAGKRVLTYTNYAKKHPDRLKVTAIVEPRADRRNALGDEIGVPADRRFASVAELAGKPKLADAVINSSVDAAHHSTAIPLLEARYDMLLEKPIALSEADVRDLIETGKRNKRVIIIAHNMRYSPFYRKALELLRSGAIGQLRTIQAAEHVSYHHMVTTFIRHPRYAGVTPTPMLVQKCCHDMDMIAFLANEPARRVASFATPSRFIPANAPAGSTKRCLDGCAVESTCPFSAGRLYVRNNYWRGYPFPASQFGDKPSKAVREKSMKADNLWGRCAWQVPEHTAIDHQNVLIEFASGMTATFDMFCATPRGFRTLRLIGSEGEISGESEEGILYLRRLSPTKGSFFTEKVFKMADLEGSHGGTDQLLIEDFIGILRNESGTMGVTRIEDSLPGHQIVFAAVQAMKTGKTIEIKA